MRFSISKSNDTAKEQYDHSNRYQDYYVFWNNFITEWSNKNVSQKAIALNIESPSHEKAMKIMNESDSDEISYILTQTETDMVNINETAKTMSGMGLNTALNVDKVKSIGNEFNSNMNGLYESIIDADMIFKLQSKSSSPIFDLNYDYKTQAQTIYNNDSLNGSEKVNGLNNIKSFYNTQYNSLFDNYKSLKGHRDNLKDTSHYLHIQSSGPYAMGIGFIAIGVLTLAGLITAPAAPVFISVGGVMIGGGITMSVLAGVLDDNSDSMDSVSETIRINKESYYIVMQDINNYIDELIESLN